MNVHPIIELLESEPERVWRASEISARFPEAGKVHNYLGWAAERGLVERVTLGTTPRNGGHLPVGYRFRRRPMDRLSSCIIAGNASADLTRQRRDARANRVRVSLDTPPLNPPLPGPQSEIVRLFAANPERELYLAEVQVYFPERRHLNARLRDLVQSGALLSNHRYPALYRFNRLPQEPSAFAPLGQQQARDKVSQRQAVLAEAARRITLNPPAEALGGTAALRLLGGNPDRWLSVAEVSAVLPGVISRDLHALCDRGFAECRWGEREGYRVTEFQFKRWPARAAASARVREVEQARAERRRERLEKKAQQEQAAEQRRREREAERQAHRDRVAQARAERLRLRDERRREREVREAEACLRRQEARPPRATPTPKPTTGLTPAQLAHQQRVAEQKRERLAREAAIKEELRMQRSQEREEAQRLKEERRLEQLRLNAEIQRQDVETIRVWIAARGQDFAEGDVARELDLAVGRIRRALKDLLDRGVLRVEAAPGASSRYSLVDPRLPQVPAVMTSGAHRVQGALQGRPAETELGLMHLTGYSREEVRAGLARLHAHGRLGWGAVGHLILYRLVDVGVQAEAEEVAA